jgi:hypothetical protein
VVDNQKAKPFKEVKETKKKVTGSEAEEFQS